jgi:hypothetical protein
MSTVRLGDLLLQAGVVNDAQLNAALSEQQRWGGRLGSLLVRMGFLSEEHLVGALSRQLKIPVADVEQVRVPAALLQRLDRAACEKHAIAPLFYKGDKKTLVVAVADPLNVVIIDDLARRTGVKIELVVAGERQIGRILGEVFAPTSTRLSPEGEDMTIVRNSGEISSPRLSVPPTPAAPPRPSPQSMPPQSMPPQAAERTIDDRAHALAVQAEVLLDLLIDKGVLSRQDVEWARLR